MPSIVPAFTCDNVPSRTMTRDRSRTVRYASFSRTRGSRWGMISSRAVARRMTPSRWTVPDPSTKPRGSTNAYSVRRASDAFVPMRSSPSSGRSAAVTCLALDERLAGQGRLLDLDAAGRGAALGEADLGHHRVGEVVAKDLLADGVHEDHRAVAAVRVP